MLAPLPVNEIQRLEALRAYDILDSPPEAAFDRITTLASQIFDVPMALVSLLDTDRQWFKAYFGLDRRQTSRDLSFCAHAILAHEVMVVPDATADERFADNELVTQSPHIRFYAGAPLITSTGHTMGTLCVLDTETRSFDEKQQNMLAKLATIVVGELELRRTARALRESEIALRDSLREKSQLAAAVSNLTTGAIICGPNHLGNPITFANPAFCDMIGYSLEEILGHKCNFIQGPKTDQAVVQQIRSAIAANLPFHGILLNYRKDGTTFWNEVTISPIFDHEGQQIHWVGLQTDVTEREQTREALNQAKAEVEEANYVLEERVRERTADLAQSQVEILKRLARAAEYRDDDTGQHTQRVARTAAALAIAIGLPEEEVSLIKQAAPLHDVGKIAVSDSILLKAGKLTEDEYTLMKKHAPVGAALLGGGRSPVVQKAELIAGTHHERWDGKGYPLGLEGAHIPLEGRILAIADVFDALTHERPYKTAWTITEAVAEIARQSGHQFDPGLVQVFLQLPHEELM